jgi:RNA polymerase sigma-70 factor (ECF subfamily)
MLMVCLRYVKSLPDAEELMLGGFMKFYSGIDRFVYAGGNITGWLKKIMVNECLMFLRKKGRLQIVDAELAEQQHDETNLLQGLNTRALYQMISDLPDGYRTVFNLFAVEGFSHREIAQLLGISEGTSKSQFSKARHQLQMQIKESELK